MAALDFPSNPTVGQQYAAPNGVTYQWDGAVWVVTGGPPGQLWTGGTGTLTPTDTTKRVVIPGATTVDQAQEVLGARTAKGRLTAYASSDAYLLTLNSFYNGSAWGADSATLPSWRCYLDAIGDLFSIDRAAPGAPSTFVNKLTIDNTGKLTAAADGDPLMTLGAGATKGGISAFAAGTGGIMQLEQNHPFAPQDLTKPSWAIRINADPAADLVQFLRRAPNAAAGTVTIELQVDNGGNLYISGATATKASGTTWANPSDRRLKDDIEDYTTGLTAILALAPRTFVYNGKGGSQAGLRGYGFIADEVAPIMPDMVGTTHAKLNPDDEEETEIQSLDTSNLVLALVNAIQELASRVATIEAHA